METEWQRHLLNKASGSFAIILPKCSQPTSCLLNSTSIAIEARIVMGCAIILPKCALLTF
eukprot:3167880-Karenia_brevis.AAC.1